jgi:hypothetical protein
VRIRPSADVVEFAVCLLVAALSGQSTLMQSTRREILGGVAVVAAAAVLPVLPSAALVKEALAPAVAHAPHDFGIFVLGCGAACDCCWYLRVDCIWSGRTVRKVGDKFIVYGRDDVVIGEADPGFKPLPDDAEWVAKVEYAKARELPHPYDWPEERHAEWRMEP